MNEVSVVAINIKTGEERVFPSIKSAAIALGCYPSEVSSAKKNGGVCHGHYIREGSATPIIDRENTRTNICFDCKKACGGCSWSEINPDTNHPRYKPVPGWTARVVKLNFNENSAIQTYAITECPLFEPDDPRKTDRRELTPEQSALFLQNIDYILKRWLHG